MHKKEKRIKPTPMNYFGVLLSAIGLMLVRTLPEGYHFIGVVIVYVGLFMYHIKIIKTV